MAHPQSFKGREKFSREEEQQIIAMYQGDGFRCPEIAEMLGIKVRTVYGVLRRWHIPVDRGRPNWMDTHEQADIDRLVALYENPAVPVQDIIEEFHVTPQTFYRILDQLGVQFRTQGLGYHKERNVIYDIAVKMYQEGVAIKEIYLATGVQYGQLYHELHARKIPRRSDIRYRDLQADLEADAAANKPEG